MTKTRYFQTLTETLIKTKANMTYSSKYINRNFLIKVSGRNYESEYINKLVGVSGLIELIGEALADTLIKRAVKQTAITDNCYCRLRRGLRVTFYSH